MPLTVLVEVFSFRHTWLVMSVKLIIVLESVRSLYNVGSVFRLADGLGVEAVYTTGITPHSKTAKDKRLPHVLKRVENQLNKTALGAQRHVQTRHFTSVEECIEELKSSGYEIVALEQTKNATLLKDYHPKNQRIALILGNEVEGASQEALNLSNIVVQIPMQGKKNSLNITSAGSIAAYHLLNLSTSN